MTTIQKHLFEMQDKKYLDFQAKLIPTVDPKTIIGVRTPELRKYAKELAKQTDGHFLVETEKFINTLPHKYYEEYNLHGFIIETIKDFDIAINLVEKFLPFVDNWATCDIISPKIFKKNPEKLLPHIKKWIHSKETFTIRYAIEMLMSIYLNENYNETYPKLVASVKSNEYYVNMMIAWYFATALAKQYDTIIPYLQNNILETWTHNKTIQKAIESYRITEEQKNYLRTLKK